MPSRISFLLSQKVRQNKAFGEKEQERPAHTLLEDRDPSSFVFIMMHQSLVSPLPKCCCEKVCTRFILSKGKCECYQFLLLFLLAKIDQIDARMCMLIAPGKLIPFPLWPQINTENKT